MPLVITNLSKTYSNGTRALKAVSLTVTEGLFGLLGPNGAGKSTLMRTIATLQTPDHGTIAFNDIDILASPDLTRRRLGYLPQEFGLDPAVRAGDLLDHFAALKGVAGRAERRRVIAETLDATNLYDHRKTKLGAFSGGMKQRFGIAQALLGAPELLILDEPTAGLDPEERSRLLDLLGALGQNRVVILSTHIVGDVAELCSEMAIISEGTVLAAEQPEAATQRLQGKIWEKQAPYAEVSEAPDGARVLSRRLVGGKRRLRVYADDKPSAGFDQAEPSLEDAYLYAIKGRTA